MWHNIQCTVWGVLCVLDHLLGSMQVWLITISLMCTLTHIHVHVLCNIYNWCNTWKYMKFFISIIHGVLRARTSCSVAMTAQIHVRTYWKCNLWQENVWHPRLLIISTSYFSISPNNTWTITDCWCVALVLQYPCHHHLSFTKPQFSQPAHPNAAFILHMFCCNFSVCCSAFLYSTQTHQVLNHMITGWKDWWSVW